MGLWGPGSGSLFSVSFSALDPTGPPAQAVGPQTFVFRVARVLNVKVLKLYDMFVMRQVSFPLQMNSCCTSNQS